MQQGLPLKIMIADDDFEDREFLKFLFDKNEKFEIIGCFDSATEVIEEIMVRNNVPDILMMDLLMPLMTGTEALDRLLSTNAAPEMYTFIISIVIDTEKQQKFAENKNVRFIKKPTTLREKNDLPGIILESLNHRNNTKV